MMRIKIVVSAVLFLGTACFKPIPLFAMTSDTDLPTSQFDITDKTQIPGSTLAPGHYSIRMLDHLSDRTVVQVENDQGKLRSTFLALPNNRLSRSGPSGAILFGDTKKAALRGFAFDNGTVVEFVYPKAQAVVIARLNSTKVPAIDPPSEGLPADNKLSRNDMSLVTLWLLSPTFVGSESKPSGVLAQRYQETVPTQTVDPVVAQSHPVPAPVGPTSSAQAPAAAAQPPVLMAQATRKPVLAHLPHTAGFSPLFWLTGMLSFFGAVLLRWKRVVGETGRA